MKITVVDNYQGEESDIILLSLVRSNENGNVGFLKTENRICVALSRAKYGLYIMGNMDNLYNSGNLWKQIKETLVNQDSYGKKYNFITII
jgi:superfamily I DNA and/or RNA helicase